MVTRFGPVDNGSFEDLTLEDWRAALEKVKDKPNRKGFMARCPAHDDGRPSLSVDQPEDKVLVKCFAECEYEDIRRAAGLEADLGTPRVSTAPKAKKPPKAPEIHSDQKVRARRTFEFKDLSGRTRYVQQHKGAFYRPVEGGWIANLDGVSKVPYNLPGLLEGVKAGETVYHLEGCKDVDTARALGLVATTTGGSNSWLPEFAAYYAGADVAIIPDRDKAGWVYAETVASSLQDVADRVRVAELPVPQGGDLTDYMEDGGTLEDLLAIVEAAPEWMPLEVSSDSSDSSDSFFQVMDKHTPFPVDAMPVKTRAFIREASAAIDCAPELVGLPVLATLSASLGHARELQVKRDYIQTASIYAVGVAGSGCGKSPAAGAAQKPLKKIQHKNYEQYKLKKEEYEQKLREHKVKAREAGKEGRPEPKPPVKPTWERTWVDNATIEALAGVVEKNPYGVAILQDELTGWLGGFDQYKSGGKGNTRQQFIDVWGGNTITIDRKGDEETTVLERPFVTIYGNIQPRLVEEMGVDREDGFINRFLLAYPPPHESRENAKEISATAELSYADLVEGLYGLRGERDSEKVTTMMEFAPGAHAYFMDLSNTLAERASDPGNPLSLRETYPKLRAYLARISLLLATCRELEAGGNMEVTVEDVSAAFRVMEYFEASARKVYHRLNSSDTGLKMLFELTSLLRRNGGAIEGTASDFQKWLPSAPDTPESTSKLLRKMIGREERLIVEDTRPGHGRALKVSLLEKTVGTVGGDPAETVSSPGNTQETPQDTPEDWKAEAMRRDREAEEAFDGVDV